jgi:hypothetical protein
VRRRFRLSAVSLGRTPVEARLAIRAKDLVAADMHAA